MDALNKLPEGVVLTRLSAKVFAVLERHTAFPWPVLAAQCRRNDIDPSDISADQLELVIEHLAGGVERFTSPEHGAAVRRELLALVRSAR